MSNVAGAAQLDWKQKVRQVDAAIPAGSVLYPFDGGNRRAAEQYRIARTKLIHHPKLLHVVAVTSPQSGDGKSVTSLNLAGTLAMKSDDSVLLVDADLRRAAVASLLNLPSYPGLEEVLRGECQLADAVVRVNLSPAIYLLPNGGRSRNPAELFESPNWALVCDEIRRAFDRVVIDTTPVGIVADYELVERVVDGVIVVARPDHTDRTVCLNALQAVSRDKLVGVITNCVPDRFSGSRNHDYGYYQAHHD